MKQIVKYLLDNACPSIKYRVKKEVLNEISILEEEMLQNQILEDRAVKEFIRKQNEEGWIEEDFHSERGVETAVRLLSEKGISPSYTPMKKMLEELEKREETFDKGCLSNVGKVLDEKGFGGSQLIRATVFAYAGIENKPFIKNQIENALDGFRFIHSIEKIDDITRQYKNKLVFKDNVGWPSIYDLRLLAFTFGWRNDDNQRMLVESINKLIQLSPIPHINVLKKSQLISPASFCMHDFKSDINSLKDKEWMMWFHRMELLSRLGVVKEIDELMKQIVLLDKMLNEDNGIFLKRLNHYFFKKWGPYAGLSLEKDWKSEKRRICDLTFRCLLILHYSRTME